MLAHKRFDALDALQLVVRDEAAVDVEFAPIVKEEFSESARIDGITKRGFRRRHFRYALGRQRRAMARLATRRVLHDLDGVERERHRLGKQRAVDRQAIHHAGIRGENAAARRAALLKRLDLPEHMTANALLEAVNILYDRETFLALARDSTNI